MTFGDFLDSKCISESKLAIRVGVSPHSVRSWRAKGFPDTRLADLVPILGLDVSEFAVPDGRKTSKSKIEKTAILEDGTLIWLD